VLLDIGMPGMDGYEVARRLRQDERFANMRIVALTGWGQDSDRRQTRNRGFTHHLTKPVSLEDLYKILT
jgi:CheY-like chemotaxis protein